MSPSETEVYPSIHRATYGVVDSTRTRDDDVMDSDSECCSSVMLKWLGMKGTMFLGNDCVKEKQSFPTQHSESSKYPECTVLSCLKMAYKSKGHY